MIRPKMIIQWVAHVEAIQKSYWQAKILLTWGLCLEVYGQSVDKSVDSLVDI